MARRTILIDVRTPTECQSTGLLSLSPSSSSFSSNPSTMSPSSLTTTPSPPTTTATATTIPTLNIEYTEIATLSDHAINVCKDDRILLYCRSGRRSGIAREALREMGFAEVHDLGGFEEAKGWLVRESEREREGGGPGEKKGDGAMEVVVDVRGERGKEVEKEKRARGFLGLVEGLRGLE